MLLLAFVRSHDYSLVTFKPNENKIMSNMKVIVFNAQRANGISAKNGNSYDICTVTIGTQVQGVSRTDRTVVGYGYQASEIGLDSAALSQFAKHQFPCELNLVIEPDPRNINRNICKGISA